MIIRDAENIRHINSVRLNMEIINKKKEEQTVKTSASTHKIWTGTYIILTMISLLCWLLLFQGIIHIRQDLRPALVKFSLGATILFFILLISSILEGLIKKRSHTLAIKYNMIRLLRFMTMIVAILVIISVINKNWYAAAVSLGFFSLILGFALQTPITSLIGWIYIILRNPYKIGDRIEINGFTGDVIEVGYMDTTLWEFGGNYMTNDLPSGRLIRFPNSLVLQSAVFNYSWKKFPYIWNEIPFHVAYEADLDFVSSTIKAVANKVLGNKMAAHVDLIKEYLKETAIPEIDIKEYPFVNFRINANTWVEVLLVYLVPPKHTAIIRSDLIAHILTELLKEPEKAAFPKSNNR